MYYYALKATIPAATTRTDAAGSEYSTYLMEVRVDVPVTPAQSGGSGSGGGGGGAGQGFETKDWVVERRYSEFLRFHTALKRRLPQIGVLPFPSKVPSPTP